jgi:hypothetical protein
VKRSAARPLEGAAVAGPGVQVRAGGDHHGVAVATAFRHPAITTILATVHPANAASVQVLEKCGLTYERTVRERTRLLYRIERPLRAGSTS